MSEIVLSALTGDASVVNGVDGTVVVAAETAGAATVALPFRGAVVDDVANGAVLGTTAAVDADIVVDGKLLISNHESVEISTYDVAERPGRQAQCQLAVARLSVNYYLDEGVEVFSRLLQLPLFPLGRVGVHEG